MKSEPRARELIARAIIVRDGALLVNRSRHGRDSAEYSALPGGHVDAGESCVQALQREIGEELNATLDVHDLCFVGEQVYAGRGHEKNEAVRHELSLFFHADLTTSLRENGVEVWSPEPEKSFCWLQLELLPATNLLPSSVKEFLLATVSDAESAHYVFEDSTAQPQR